MSYERVRNLTSRNPATVFELPHRGTVAEGNYADLVLVDPDDVQEIRAGRLHTNCDWTPFEGWNGIFPEWTMVRGEMVYEHDADESFGDPRGRNVRTVEYDSGPVDDAETDAETGGVTTEGSDADSHAPTEGSDADSHAPTEAGDTTQ